MRIDTYGYARPRNSDDQPVRLPIDLFETQFVRWEKSEIVGAGLDFASVRVVRTSLAKKLELEFTIAAQVGNQTARPLGRPSRKGEINRAMNALFPHGQIPIDEPRKAVFQSIRRKVIENNPLLGTRGLGDEVIRRAIADYEKSHSA